MKEIAHLTENAKPEARAGDPDAQSIDPEPAPARPKAQRLRRPLGEVLDFLRKVRAKGGGALEGINLPGIGRSVPPPVPDGAHFLTRSFANAAGSRRYKLYIPTRAKDAPRGLVVMLHGCRQNPDDFATGTRMNALAEARNLFVAYPEQNSGANSSSCWNWFNPGDQTRGAGEPSIIAGITSEIVAEFGLADDRVFIAGLSAGGAMAAVMAETYPELFSAVGVHSGLAYGSADDVMSAFAAMRGEPTPSRPRARATGIRTIVFHGAADRTVHPSNATRILAGAGSGGERETAVAGGRRFARTIFTAGESAPAFEYWEIEGAGHAWSGGDAKGSFADPRGPDASAEMLRFFLAD